MSIFRRLRDFLFSRQVDITSAAVVIAVSIMASLVLGLVRDRVLAQFFAGSEIAIYFAAFRIPDTLFEILVVGSFSSAFIPTFISYISQRKEEEAWKITGIMINLALSAFIVLAGLVFVFAPQLARVIAPGFSAAEIALMVPLTRILLLAQGFFVVSIFMTGVLRSFQHFLVPALAPVFYNLSIVLAMVFFSGSLGIYAPVFGAVAGAAAHFLVQFPMALRLGFRPRLSFDLSHPGVRRIIKLAAPRVAELGFAQLLKASDLFFSSLISTASYAYLTFATHLELVPVSLFGISLADAALPALAYRQGDRKAFQQIFFATFRQIIFLILPVAVVFIVLRIPLVRLAFGAARFTWDSTVLTAYTLSLFAIGIIGQALAFYFVRAFYAMQDTLTPVTVGIADILFDIALSAYFILFLKMPIWGLGLSSAIASLVQAAVLGLILIRRRGLPVFEFLVPLLRVGFASLVSGGVMYVIMKVLDRSAWDHRLSFLGRFVLPEEWSKFVLDTRYTKNLVLLTLLVMAIGAVVYLAVCRLVRVQETNMLGKIWRRLPVIGRVRVPPATVPHEHP